MRRLIIVVSSMLLVGLAASPAGAADGLDIDESLVEARTGFAGFVELGGAYYDILGNSMPAPELTLGFGGQGRHVALYGVISGATGDLAPNVRATLGTVGIRVEGRWVAFASVAVHAYMCGTTSACPSPASPYGRASGCMQGCITTFSNGATESCTLAPEARRRFLGAIIPLTPREARSAFASNPKRLR